MLVVLNNQNARILALLAAAHVAQRQRIIESGTTRSVPPRPRGFCAAYQIVKRGMPYGRLRRFQVQSQVKMLPCLMSPGVQLRHQIFV